MIHRIGAACVFVIALQSAPVAAQPHLDWLHQFGTKEDDRAAAIALDGAGGVFVGGDTAGSLAEQNKGVADCFVARFNSSHALVWQRQFGTPLEDRVGDAAPDGRGGFLAVGITRGKLGDSAFGLQDAFVARFDGDGNQNWLRQFGGTKDDSAWGVAVDNAGDVFVVGNTQNKLGSNSFGSYDTYLAKYTLDGSVQWLVQFGTKKDDLAYSVALDGAGGAFVCGQTNALLGMQEINLWDAFVARFDGEGNQLWLKILSSSMRDFSFEVTADGESGVILSGGTVGDLGGADPGGEELFLARYSADGTQLWIMHPDAIGKGGQAPDGEGGVFVGAYDWGDMPIKMIQVDALGHTVGSTGISGSYDGYCQELVSDGIRSFYFAGATHDWVGEKYFGYWDAIVGHFEDSCIADCDKSGEADIDDFICFQGWFAAGSLVADCDRSGALDIDDFICFQIAFGVGCP